MFPFFGLRQTTGSHMIFLWSSFLKNWSLFQITRRPQNHLPRERPAPTPNSEPTAIAFILSSQCPPADSPTHTPATPPRPTPTLSLPGAPKKLSLSCAARALALPPTRPTGAQPLAHVCAVSPHRSRPIPQSRHPLLQFTHIRATLAQARDRPRGPESLSPDRYNAPGIRRGIPRGRPVPTDTRPVGPSTPCPTLSRGVTLLRRIAHAGITELRRTVGAPSYEYNRMSQKLTEFAFPLSRGQRLGAPSNLKQSPELAAT